MKSFLRSIIINVIPKFIKQIISNDFVNKNHLNLSYSQEGEDLILSRFFGEKKEGLFIDVGAHHPFRFSNTNMFYNKGWRGINIDPLPGAIDLFNNYRPFDVNLPFGIAKVQGSLVYYNFSDPALNTFSKEKAEQIETQTNYKLISKINCQVFPLSLILEKYLSDNSKIDFLTIDCEGLDLEVLSSNDWDKYRPTIVLAESHTSNINQMHTCMIYNFMTEKGYELYAKTHYTFFYKDKKC